MPHTPSLLQLARFSSATWNFHRIHVDTLAAAEDGLPGPAVQSTLFAELAWHAVRQWLVGLEPRLVAVEWRNLRPVAAGQTITWTCLEATAVGDPAAGLMTIRLEALGPEEQATVEATVTVRASSQGPSAQGEFG